MFSINDISIIIPTKDRPEKIKRLLSNLSSFNSNVNQVIVISSGSDISKITDLFINKLNLIHIKSLPGQIKQRNIGIKNLNEKTKLVATFDDDITLLKDSLNNILRFWNSAEKNTAGVGFNVVNYGNNKKNDYFFNKLIKNFFLRQDTPGKILKSGINTPLHNLSKDCRVQWLNGGATVWKKEILINYPNNQVETKWAVYEDVLYSYPLGKKYPLFVSCDSQIEVEDVPFEQNNITREYYIGKAITLWRFKLIQKNMELSIYSFTTTILITIIYYFMIGIIKFNLSYIIKSSGYLSGLLTLLFKIKFFKDIDDLIKNNL
tara:strand:+ start:969 stop:1925 length:957 start_codon:yes stop_codon:yes gene_type:complete